MKEFHIYGIGNALVDIDFEVCVDTLKRLNISKGLMTLIDEKTHHLFLEELDGIKHLKTCGGSAANALFTAQQLGSKTFYSCKIGDDEAGDFFYRDLILHGIQTNLHLLPREGITGKCIVLVTPDADRTMNTFLGATAKFSKEQLSETDLKNSEYLYIEGYLVAAPTGCEAAILASQWANKYGVKTALTLSDPNMVMHFKDGLLEIMSHKIDILFCNEQEALLFSETENMDDAKLSLKKYAKTFIVTLGEKGALVYDGMNYSQIPAYQTKVIDTVGAGDVFAGTFLYAITQGLNYAVAADWANFAASKVVTKFGPRLNNNEIEIVKSNFSNFAAIA